MTEQPKKKNLTKIQIISIILIVALATSTAILAANLYATEDINRHNIKINSQLFAEINTQKQQIKNLNSTFLMVCGELDNKTRDYNAILRAFAQFANYTTITLDNTWKPYTTGELTTEGRPQGIYIVSYTNGTHLAGQLYFKEENIWSNMLLGGKIA